MRTSICMRNGVPHPQQVIMMQEATRVHPWNTLQRVVQELSTLWYALIQEAVSMQR